MFFIQLKILKINYLFKLFKEKVISKVTIKVTLDKIFWNINKAIFSISRHLLLF